VAKWRLPVFVVHAGVVALAWGGSVSDLKEIVGAVVAGSAGLVVYGGLQELLQNQKARR